ncbi:DUF4910 domain-containing protein [Crocinitomix catalasitica]|uniref:DUF4910 domain-containing protein n=1 Tax=Crocinitomix catalasitica TaxID=184607 RepID=UPI0004813A2D|nr:DUF4910 domain-containing protein [Crocinitomix catalasitica]
MQRREETILLDNLFDELFPIMRSITGPGIEASMKIFKRYMPLVITKTPSGSEVFDWTVPQEWHFKKAVLRGPNNKIICDADVYNLHVLNYSESVDKKLSLDELLPHIYTNPKLPHSIPYVTSYYKKKWGFCLSEDQKKSLKEGIYHAKIETKFVDGGLPIAQCILPGESSKEILLTSYLCHPSMANNQLSGPLVILALYNRIKGWKKRRYTYRFLLNPENIGSICFLKEHGSHLMENLKSGLVLTCLGGPSNELNYKQSKEGNSLMDVVVSNFRNKSLMPINIIPHSGNDTSNKSPFSSNGFNLPMGQFSRILNNRNDEYKNSLDNKNTMRIENLVESTNVIEKILKYVEICGNPINMKPFEKPQISRRVASPNLNSKINGDNSYDNQLDSNKELNYRMILLKMANGKNNLFDIAEKCNCSVDQLIPIVELLESKDIIKYNEKTPII